MREIKHEHQREMVFVDDHPLFKTPEYRNYRTEWNKRPREKRYGDFPVNLDVSVTNHCNLSCTMCKRTVALADKHLWWSGEVIDPRLQFLDIAIYKKVIDESAANGLQAVHLTGHDGEPTLHKQLPEMIAYARQKEITDVFTHSNATLLHRDDLIDRILDAQPHRIIFSIDSPVKETFEKIRVGANFELVVNNIKAFIRKKREKNLLFPIVKVQMVVMEQNRHEVDLFKRLFRDDAGADVLGFTEFLDYHALLDKKQGVTHPTPGQTNMHYVCDYPYRRLRLDQSGLVYACLTGQYHRLGDARMLSLKEMWHGPVMQKLRSDHLRYGAGKTVGCETCGRQWTAERLIAPDLNAEVVEFGYRPTDLIRIGKTSRER
jgi:MoaA/NifB/PqqE/SkfB family radical SAM enzyme